MGAKTCWVPKSFGCKNVVRLNNFWVGLEGGTKDGGRGGSGGGSKGGGGGGEGQGRIGLRGCQMCDNKFQCRRWVAGWVGL